MVDCSVCGARCEPRDPDDDEHFCPRCVREIDLRYAYDQAELRAENAAADLREVQSKLANTRETLRQLATHIGAGSCRCNAFYSVLAQREPWVIEHFGSERPAVLKAASTRSSE